VGEQNSVRPLEDSVSNVDAPVSRSGVVMVTAVAALGVNWFLVALLVLHKPMIDAIGEAAGGAVAALLVASVIGAMSQKRQR
jgi:hypothetical protein